MHGRDERCQDQAPPSAAAPPTQSMTLSGSFHLSGRQAVVKPIQGIEAQRNGKPGQAHAIIQPGAKPLPGIVLAT